MSSLLPFQLFHNSWHASAKKEQRKINQNKVVKIQNESCSIQYVSYPNNQKYCVKGNLRRRKNYVIAPNMYTRAENLLKASRKSKGFQFRLGKVIKLWVFYIFQSFPIFLLINIIHIEKNEIYWKQNLYSILNILCKLCNILFFRPIKKIYMSSLKIIFQVACIKSYIRQIYIPKSFIY